jgi:hypothetical protein
MWSRKFTSHTKVYLSCHLAFLGKKVFEPIYAMSPRVTTPPKEYAEVAVNIGESITGI